MHDSPHPSPPRRRFRLRFRSCLRFLLLPSVMLGSAMWACTAVPPENQVVADLAPSSVVEGPTPAPTADKLAPPPVGGDASPQRVEAVSPAISAPTRVSANAAKPPGKTGPTKTVPARLQQPPREPKGGRAATGGPPCGPGKPCPDPLVCGGLFEKATGTCIAAERARRVCGSRGGEWGKWGRMQSEFCMEVFGDAGKTCRDSSECDGKCLQASQTTLQTCQRYRLSYGCHAEVTDGQPGGTLCRD
ncbi:MAG: hypothetical protein V3V08_08065 [Nannocystaceae bacterium]